VRLLKFNLDLAACEWIDRGGGAFVRQQLVVCTTVGRLGGTDVSLELPRQRTLVFRLVQTISLWLRARPIPESLEAAGVVMALEMGLPVLRSLGALFVLPAQSDMDLDAQEAGFLLSLRTAPSDVLTWLAYADYLTEPHPGDGRQDRGERMRHWVTSGQTVTFPSGILHGWDGHVTWCGVPIRPDASHPVGVGVPTCKRCLRTG
jgi:uncharacterized protein (TIGR02996 family)